MKSFINNLARLQEALKHLPYDIKVELADAFDKNFDNESFFGKKWTPSKYVSKDNKRSGKARKLLNKSGGGGLRGSFKYTVNGYKILISSNKPYAAIHNEGGTINHPGGTAYFYDTKKKQLVWVRNTDPKAADLPRTKPHKIEIPQRQFIGHDKEVDKLIENEIDKVFIQIMK